MRFVRSTGALIGCLGLLLTFLEAPFVHMHEGMVHGAVLERLHEHGCIIHFHLPKLDKTKSDPGPDVCERESDEKYLSFQALRPTTDALNIVLESETAWRLETPHLQASVCSDVDARPRDPPRASLYSPRSPPA